MHDFNKLCFIGAGNMCEALLAGIISSKFFPVENIILSDIRKQRLKYLEEKYNVKTTMDNKEAVKVSGMIFFSVKPQNIATVLEEVGELLRSDQMVISIAVGIPTYFIESYMKEEVPVIRVMPNTPALFQSAISVLSKGKYANDKHLNFARELLSCVGDVDILPEKLQNAAAAINGCGPAYFFYFIESLVDAGISVGLNKDIAKKLAVQTMEGSVKMLKESGKSPTELRRMVTSPGGTTITALEQFEKGAIRYHILKAIKAATNRAEELSKQLMK